MYAASVTFRTIDELDAALREADYLPDRGLATALFLALALEKPVLLEGEAGVGKTEAAKALATALGARLIRLQCYEGLDVSHAVYEWNYPRQLLHIRAAQEGTVSEEELFGPEFLIRRPLLEAIDSDEPVVLLIDEIDRADEEFEAFLLEVLSDFQITIPELGTIRARRKPAVILTSNRTRELHDALKRRCLFHWIGHPAIEREVEIVMLRVPGIPERLAEGGRRVRPRPARRSISRSRPASPRRSTGRRRSPRSAARRSTPRSSSRRSARCSSTARTSRRCATRRSSASSKRPARARAARSGMQGSAIVRHVVTFGRVLREVGIEVGPGRVADAVRGLDAVDLTRQDDVYFTLRQTLVSRHDELELFDRAFVAWFLRGPVAPLVRQKQTRRFADRVARDTLESGADDDEGDESATPHELGASGHELLREKDFAEMTPEEFERVRRLMAAIARTRPRRMSRRRSPDPSRRRARHATALPHVAADGRRADRADAGRRARPSRGSSSSSATSPARWTRTRGRSSSTCTRSSGTGRGVEAFAFGTRLTRLTPDLATRDPEAALARANESAVDWGSGTRIGASLGEFNDDLRPASAVARRGRRHRLGRLGARRSRPRRAVRWRSSPALRTRSSG